MNPQNPYQPPQAIDEGPLPSTASGMDGGTVPTPIMEAMRQTKPWVTFLAILGFIFTGLMILAGIAMLVMGAMGGLGKLSPGFGLLYVVLALLYVLPSLSLFRYGTGIRKLLDGGGIEGLTHALVCQKSFWRLIGIMTLVVFALYMLALAGGAFAFLLRASPR